MSGKVPCNSVSYKTPTTPSNFKDTANLHQEHKKQFQITRGLESLKIVPGTIQNTLSGSRHQMLCPSDQEVRLLGVHDLHKAGIQIQDGDSRLDQCLRPLPSRRVALEIALRWNGPTSKKGFLSDKRAYNGDREK